MLDSDTKAAGEESGIWRWKATAGWKYDWFGEYLLLQVVQSLDHPKSLLTSWTMIVMNIMMTMTIKLGVTPFFFSLFLVSEAMFLLVSTNNSEIWLHLIFENAQSIHFIFRQPIRFLRFDWKSGHESQTSGAWPVQKEECCWWWKCCPLGNWLYQNSFYFFPLLLLCVCICICTIVQSCTSCLVKFKTIYSPSGNWSLNNDLCN